MEHTLFSDLRTLIKIHVLCLGALVVIWLTVLGNFRQQLLLYLWDDDENTFFSLDFLYNSTNNLSQEISNCKSKVQNRFLSVAVSWAI